MYFSNQVNLNNLFCTSVQIFIGLVLGLTGPVKVYFAAQHAFWPVYRI